MSKLAFYCYGLLLLCLPTAVNALVENPVTRAANNFYDARHIIVYSTISIRPGNFDFNGRFPLSQKSLDNLTIDTLRRRIETDRVKIVLDKYDNYSNVTAHKDDAVYLRIEYTYWDKGRFSPSISHDILAIQIMYKRYLPHTAPEREKDHIPEETRLSNILISVPEDNTDLAKSLTDTMDDILTRKVAKPINCANSKGCN